MRGVRRGGKETFDELDRRIPPRYVPGDESGIFVIASEAFRTEDDPKYRGRYYRVTCKFCGNEGVRRQEKLARAEVEGSYCQACKKTVGPTRGAGDKPIGDKGGGPIFNQKYPVGLRAGPFEVIGSSPAGKSWVYTVQCVHCKTQSVKTSATVKDALRRNYVVCGGCRDILGSTKLKEMYRARWLEMTKALLEAKVVEDEDEGVERGRERLVHEELEEFDPEVLKLALSGRWGVDPPITFGIRCWVERL